MSELRMPVQCSAVPLLYPWRRLVMRSQVVPCGEKRDHPVGSWNEEDGMVRRIWGKIKWKMCGTRNEQGIFTDEPSRCDRLQ